MVNLAFIEQVCGGPCPIKHENCLAFQHQLEETYACCAANAKCKKAHKKSLTICLEVSLTNCLMPTVSTLAASIASKPILIDFKKVQGKNRVKVF
jgi:hypothetical protein